MKELNKWQNLLLQSGGILLVVGAALPMFDWGQVGAMALLGGAILFGGMQLLCRYDGHNIVVKRLRHMQVIASTLFIVSGILAVSYEWGLSYNFGFHLGSGEWKLCLSIATVLEIYSAFRLPTALHGEDD